MPFAACSSWYLLSVLVKCYLAACTLTATNFGSEPHGLGLNCKRPNVASIQPQLMTEGRGETPSKKCTRGPTVHMEIGPLTSDVSAQSQEGRLSPLNTSSCLLHP